MCKAEINFPPNAPMSNQYQTASSINAVCAIGYDNVLEIPMDFSDVSPLAVQLENKDSVDKSHRRDYKALWKRAILDQILLIRMEKANSSLKACQDWVAHKRCKMDFEDPFGILDCPEELIEVWQDLLGSENSISSLGYDYVYAVVKSGIPKLMRGEAWKFLRNFNMQKLRESHAARELLIEQSDEEKGEARREGAECSSFVFTHDNGSNSIVVPLSTLEFKYDYESLIRKKSKHQNDIFLDLDRTFPSHPYFAEKYGMGQLALYNILRAYSIIDDDVGYCQGMSFVASIVLIHLSEEDSFEILRYLMQALNLRRQYRPPNMTGLQVKQYQLQRLLHDRLPRLHSHLQKLEIPPTLYATAWFLTLFSSQFPMALVVRLFDLVLLDGPDVVFKVAIVIFTKFEDEIMYRSSFEAVINMFKTRLPELVNEHAFEIIKTVFESNFEYLNKQLFAYEVEYQVMREEEIINSRAAGIGGSNKSSMSRSETSSDIHSSSTRNGGDASALERSTSGISSLQKQNEFCLEKVAALNKKLDREKYALELKTQQLKQQNYDLQDQVASLQKEECKLHSAIMLLVQEREMLIRSVQHLESSSNIHNAHNYIAASGHGAERSSLLNNLNLCYLNDILPPQLVENCRNQINANIGPVHSSTTQSTLVNGTNVSHPNGVYTCSNDSSYYSHSPVSTSVYNSNSAKSSGDNVYGHDYQQNGNAF